MVKNAYNHGKNIWDKFYCSCQIGTTGNVQFLLSKSFMLVLEKFSFQEEDSALGYNSKTFSGFADILLSHKFFAYSQWKENLVKYHVSKYYDHDCRFKLENFS